MNLDFKGFAKVDEHGNVVAVYERRPLPHSKGKTPKGYSPTTFPRPYMVVESPLRPAHEGPTNRKATRQRCKERRRARKRQERGDRA